MEAWASSPVREGQRWSPTDEDARRSAGLLLSWSRALSTALKSKTASADSIDMDVSAIALQGLAQAQVQLESAAASIAGASTASNSAGTDTVDLSTAVVALLTAKNQFSVDLTVLKVANQTQASVINLFG